MKKTQAIPQPNGTIRYEIQKSDTLVSIAAQHDVSVTLLKKLNKMISETIFPGQVLYVPGPDFVALNSAADKSKDRRSSAPVVTKSCSSDNQALQFDLSTSPVKSIPGHAERQAVPMVKQVTLPRALSEDEVKKIDEECHQRFVKMDAKYIDPDDEEVPGILLVTPDAIMFDADESHPLVHQHGREAYQFVASIYCVVMVSVYHGSSTLKFGRDENNKVIPELDPTANDVSKESTQNHAEKSDEIKASSDGTSGSLTVTSIIKGTNAEKCTTLNEVDNVLSEALENSAETDPHLRTEASLNKPTTSIESPEFNLLGAEGGSSAENPVGVSAFGDVASGSVTEKISRSPASLRNEESFEIVKTDSLQSALDQETLETKNSSRLAEQTTQRISEDPVASPENGGMLTVFVRVKVDRSVDTAKGCHSDSPPTAIGRGPVKPEYWYSIPCDKADALFAFFIQWTTDDGSKGFLAVKTDSATDYKHYKLADGQKLVCELVEDWELMSISEYHRIQLQQEIKQLPLPELSENSSIMGTSHLSMLICHLPPIAEGSPWKLVYSTSKHGFSLNTLYRKMLNVETPIFLIVQDVNDQVFGAMLSCALKISEHFYGSGECYLFTFYPEFKKFGWTGLNSFFVKGNKDSLAIGAGEGSNGLWLDGNLYHGRTQQCLTYENELLTISQDFTIKCLETWCFD